MNKQSYNNSNQIKLSVFNHIADIKNALLDTEQQVIIITGSTGCGKSTQIPQIIYNLFTSTTIYDSSHRVIQPNIVCTQPRKVACRTLARRVTQEMNHKLNLHMKEGQLVGYQVKDEEYVSRQTRIKFVTTGVLLNSIVSSKDLSRYSHIVLDEVHERSEDIDFLMCLIRQVLQMQQNLHVKLIVMSATVDEGKFAKYFNKESLVKAAGKGNVKTELAVVYNKVLKWIKGTSNIKNETFTSNDQDDDEMQDMNYWRKKNMQKIMQPQVKEEVKQPGSKFVLKEWFTDDVKGENKSWHCIEDTQDGDVSKPTLDCPIIRLEGQSFPIELSYIEMILREMIGYYSVQTSSYIETSKYHMDVDAIFQSIKQNQSNSFSKNDLATWKENKCRTLRVSMEHITTYYIKQDQEIGTASFMEDITFEIMFEILLYIELNYLQKSSRFQDVRSEMKGSVLIFLPGLFEINGFKNLIVNYQNKSNDFFDPVQKWILNNVISNLYPVMIHSTLNKEEQDRIFEKVDNPRRKIIISTNIAESSITVPDVKFIIDSCLIKDNYYDYNLDCSKLKVNYSSKASLRQRMGRTGRVEAGHCFRLITEKFFEEILSDYNDPEILRCQIERILLKTKISNLGEPIYVLSDLIDRPSDYTLGQSIKNLVSMGALTYPNELHPSGCVTAFGTLMGMLPCDINLTRMIITGYTLGVLNETIAIASIQCVDRDLFLTKNQFDHHVRKLGRNHDKSYYNLNLLKDNDVYDCYRFQSRLYFDQDLQSDHLTNLRVLYEWLEIRKDLKKKAFDFSDNSYPSNVTPAEMDWAYKNLINLHNLRYVYEQYSDLINRIYKHKFFKPSKYEFSMFNDDHVNALKLAIASAFLDKFSKGHVSITTSNNKLMNKIIKIEEKGKDKDDDDNQNTIANMELTYVNMPAKLMSKFAKYKDNQMIHNIFETQMAENINKILQESSKNNFKFSYDIDNNLVKVIFNDLPASEIRSLIQRNDSIRVYHKRSKDYSDFNYIKVNMSQLRNELNKIIESEYYNDEIPQTHKYKDFNDFYSSINTSDFANSVYIDLNRSQGSVETLNIKCPRFYYKYSIDYSLDNSNVTKKSQIHPDSVCSNLLVFESDKFHPINLLTTLMHERNSTIQLKSNTVIPYEMESSISLLRLIYDNYTQLVYDHATNTYCAVNNKFTMFPLDYFISNDIIIEINDMRTKLYLLKDNDHVEVDSQFYNSIKSIVIQSHFKINKAILLCLSLSNYIQSQLNMNNKIIVDETEYRSLNQIKTEQGKFNSIIYSKEFEKYINQCYYKNKSYNYYEFENLQHNKIVVKENVTEINDNIYNSTLRILEEITDERDKHCKRMRAQSHGLGYRNFNDITIVCKFCYQQLFKISQLLGVGDAGILKINEMAFIPFYKTGCKQSNLDNKMNQTDGSQEYLIEKLFNHQFKKILQSRFDFDQSQVKYITCGACFSPFGVEITSTKNNETHHFLLPTIEDYESLKPYVDTTAEVYSYNVIVISSRVENLTIQMLENKATDLKTKFNALMNKYHAKWSGKCSICPDEKYMNKTGLQQHYSSDTHKDTERRFINNLFYNVKYESKFQKFD